MIETLKNRFLSVYHKVVSSIAFYPSLILTGFFLLAALMLTLEDYEITPWLIKHAPYLVINNADTARSILSTIIGGLISMMVFSFSMVMMILSQASSNFSPRLLPGLVSDKRNQIVLGTYLGTIVYNILILMSVLPDGNQYTLNGFSILLGMILGIMCLVAFIYFIHTISSGIQINNILEGIFNSTKDRLTQLLGEKHEDIDVKNQKEKWYYLKSKNASYYQGVNLKGLIDVCQRKKINIRIIPYIGEYLLPNVELLAIDKDLGQEELERIHSYFLFADSRDIAENYFLGIKQITEVGVKAMSPGINDPGTAVMTLDYLTELLALRMQLKEYKIYKNPDCEHTLQIQSISFEMLMHQVLAAYRQYCKHDTILMEKMVSMLKYLLLQKTSTDDYYGVITAQLDIIKEDIESHISNSSDRQMLREMIADN